MSSNELSPEVSGQAAFWILASLAAAVIVLPSTSHRVKGRILFGNKIELVRCIPGVCIIDTIIDIIWLQMRVRKAITTPEPGKYTRSARRIAARLMLALFVVFPQTMRAFSLQGVPGTKLCVFVFFLAFVTRLLIELCGMEVEGVFPPPEGEDDKEDPFVLLSVLFQAPFEIWIWYNINHSMGKLELSYGFGLFWFAVSLFCCFSICLQGLIWLAFVITRRRFDISDTPHIVPMQFLWVVLMAVSLADPRETPSKSDSGLPPPPDYMRHFTQALNLMLLAALSSIAVAKILDCISRLVSPHRIKDASTQTETRPADDKEELKEDGREEEPSSAPKGSCLGRLGVVVDRWFVQCLILNSATSVSIALTVFNLITTVMYYLVYFDGTGTVNPGWTSVLG